MQMDTIGYSPRWFWLGAELAIMVGSISCASFVIHFPTSYHHQHTNHLKTTLFVLTQDWTSCVMHAMRPTLWPWIPRYGIREHCSAP